MKHDITDKKNLSPFERAIFDAIKGHLVTDQKVTIQSDGSMNMTITQRQFNEFYSYVVKRNNSVVYVEVTQ